MTLWMFAWTVSAAHAQAHKSFDFNLEEEPDGFGAGVVVGEPTGLSLAWRNGEKSAIQSHIGFNATNDWFHVSVDYLHNLVVYESPDMPGVVWPVYIGIGARLWAGNGWTHDGHYYSEPGLGIRVPVGISLLPRRLGVDVFLEGVPVMLVFPYTRGYLDFGLGARVYF